MSSALYCNQVCFCKCAYSHFLLTLLEYRFQHCRLDSLETKYKVGPMFATRFTLRSDAVQLASFWRAPYRTVARGLVRPLCSSTPAFITCSNCISSFLKYIMQITYYELICYWKFIFEDVMTKLMSKKDKLINKF